MTTTTTAPAEIRPRDLKVGQRVILAMTAGGEVVGVVSKNTPKAGRLWVVADGESPAWHAYKAIAHIAIADDDQADDSDDPTSVLHQTETPSPTQLEGRAADVESALTPTIEGALTGAGIPRAGHATIVSTLDALGVDRDAQITDDQAKRLAARIEGREKVGLSGKAALTWIITGDDGATQTKKAALERQMREAAATGAKRSASSPRNAGVDPADQTAAALATEAAAAKGKPLSQRVAPKEIVKAREVMAAMLADAFKAGRFPNAGDADRMTLIPACLGFTSERAMREYVDGRTTVLKDDAKAGVKALTKGIASHQVWARKAAAAAFGVYLAAQKTEAK